MLAGNPPFQTAVSTDWWFRAVSSGRHDRFWAAHLRGCPDFPLLAQVFYFSVAAEAQRASWGGFCFWVLSLYIMDGTAPDILHVLPQRVFACLIKRRHSEAQRICSNPLSQAFLNRIFVADPTQRATLEELKSHPWLAGDVLPPRALYEELLQRKG